MSNLQSLGRGHSALGSITNRATGAYERVLAAQTAIASNDFKQSEVEFAAAKNLLTQARSELDTALSNSRTILEVLDVTGTIRSGDKLLVASESLTEAGLHISRAAGPLLSSKYTPFSPLGSGDGDEGNDTSASSASGQLTNTLLQSYSELAHAERALTQAAAALTDVNPRALPPSLQDQVTSLKEAVPRIHRPLQRILSQSELLLALLGTDRPRQYLLLFQNNHELRPTGGFIGSIALINVDQGQVENIDVQTVYDPDGQLKDYIAPPDPLRPIVDRWYMRDANWFVDFDKSAAKVATFFEKSGGPTPDGVIAITPDVIKQLLAVTGPIEVPAYNVTVTAENFVPVTQDLVTYQYDRQQNRPKQFLVDFTPLLLNKLFGTESGSSLAVFDAIAQSANAKHLQFYFADDDEQQHVADLGWDGRVPREQSGLLYVNNANIGGHKSDQFIEQEIDYRSDVTPDGDVDVVVTVRRTHTGPATPAAKSYPDGENPAFKDNIIYQRLLVPTGAKLMEVRGTSSLADIPHPLPAADDITLNPDADVVAWQQQRDRVGDTAIGEESGYTYFASWVVTKPGATSIVLYRYRLPGHAALPGLLNPATTYSVDVIKQPGDTNTTVRVELKLPENLRLVHTVPHDGTTQTDQHTLVYRGELDRDRLVGVVTEKQ